MSRRRLLEILQQRCARARRASCTSAPRRPTSTQLAGDPRPGGRRRRAQLGGPGPVRGRRSGPSWTSRRCKYMWLGTDKVFDAFKFYIRETPHGVMQIHGYPYDAHGQHVHRRDARRRLAARPASTRSRPRTFAPGRVRREVDRADRASCSPTSSTATQVHGQQLAGGSASPRCATRAGGTSNVVLLGDAAHTAHFSIGSGTKLAMEDALALAACLHEQPRRRRSALDAYEAERKAGRRCPPSAPRRPAWSGSRTWASTSTRTRAVRVQHHDPQPPGHLRQPAAARPRVRRPRRRLVRRHEQRRGTGSRPRRPADVPAVPAARAGAGQPVVVSPMDMYSRGRRHAERLPPRPPRRQGARRRRAGDDRDGLRLGRRAGSRRAAPASSTDEQAAALAPDHRLRARARAPRRSASSSATPAARAPRS